MINSDFRNRRKRMFDLFYSLFLWMSILVVVLSLIIGLLSVYFMFFRSHVLFCAQITEYLCFQSTFDLENRTVLITGAANGLGYRIELISELKLSIELAKQLLMKNCNLILWDKDEVNLVRAYEEFKRSASGKQQIYYQVVDLSDSNQV